LLPECWGAFCTWLADEDEQADDDDEEEEEDIVERARNLFGKNLCLSEEGKQQLFVAAETPATVLTHSLTHSLTH